jgi:hypothetical protein
MGGPAACRLGGEQLTIKKLACYKFHMGLKFGLSY